MWRQRLDDLHPYGWTSRRTYRLAFLALAAAMAAAVGLVEAGFAGLLAVGLVAAFAWLILLPLTVRRLRDAGLSLWWVLLMAFGVDIKFDALRMGPVEIPIDPTDLLWLVPVVMGLLARGRPVEERVV
jgi:uncharacterized membrane protein YhaH (DUF805 family)